MYTLAETFQFGETMKRENHRSNERTTNYHFAGGQKTEKREFRDKREGIIDLPEYPKAEKIFPLLQRETERREVEREREREREEREREKVLVDHPCMGLADSLRLYKRRKR